MAPYCNSTDIYVAVKEISTSLSHLRHEHSDSKTAISRMFDQILTQQRHMNRIDELIDQHQAKIDELMHVAVSLEQNRNSFQAVPEVHTAIEQSPLQVPVSDWSTAPIPAVSWSNAAVCAAEVHNSDSPSSNSPHDDQITGMPSPVVTVKSEKMEDSNAATVPFEFVQKETTSAMDVRDSTHDTLRVEDSTISTRKYRTASSSTTQQPPRQAQQHRQKQQQHKRIRLKAGGNLSLNSRMSVCDKQTVNSVRLSNTNQSLASFIVAARQFDASGKIVGYYCCGHVFKMKAKCERHVLSKHTDERPFKCNSCSYATIRKDALLRHRSTCQYYLNKR